MHLVKKKEVLTISMLKKFFGAFGARVHNN